MMHWKSQFDHYSKQERCTDLWEPDKKGRLNSGEAEKFMFGQFFKISSLTEVWLCSCLFSQHTSSKFVSLYLYYLNYLLKCCFTECGFLSKQNYTGGNWSWKRHVYYLCVFALLETPEFNLDLDPSVTLINEGVTLFFFSTRELTFASWGLLFLQHTRVSFCSTSYRHVFSFCLFALSLHPGF